MWRRTEMARGLFAVPEEQLGVLGDVRGLDVLDLACGTGYVAAGSRAQVPGWSHWTSPVISLHSTTAPGTAGLPSPCPGRRGAGPVGQRPVLDPTASEHGAAAWRQPGARLPEVARLSRPGGRSAFLTNSNLSTLCVPAEAAWHRTGCSRPARGPPCRWPGWRIEFHPSHGEWVGQLRRSYSSWRRWTSSTRRPTASTTPSTRSCHRSGRRRGRRRSLGGGPRPSGAGAQGGGRRPLNRWSRRGRTSATSARRLEDQSGLGTT